SIVIAGVVFEALMLLFMFVVMLFTPSEDALPSNQNEETPENELLVEIGEIATDFATAVTKLETLGDNVKSLLIQQTEILSLLRESNEMTRQIISPSPKLLEIMEQTNKSLVQFNETLEKLNQSATQLKQEEIEIAVRRELEKFFANMINNKNAK
ncbi:MAG: hypothetical protein ACK42G_08425, partial [Candidatus Kapaibacteriota bacterium]